MIKKILLMVILTMAIAGCTAEDIAIWKEVSRERRNLRIGECLDRWDCQFQERVWRCDYSSYTSIIL